MNEPVAVRSNSELRHSGMGIASFVMSVLFGIGAFLVFVYAGYEEITIPGGVAGNRAMAMMIGFSMMLMWALLLVGAVLGTIALFEQNRKKVFALLGLIFSLGTLILSALVIVLGLTMSH